MDLEAILKFSIMGWWQDRQAIKYLLLIFALNLAFLAGILAYVFVFLLPGLPTTAAELMKINWIELILPLAGGIIAAVIVLAVLQAWLTSLLQIRALQLLNLKPVALDFYKVIRIIVLNIVRSFYVLLSIFDLKWLALGIAAVALTLIGAFGVAFLGIFSFIFVFLGILLFIGYYIVIIRNSIRLLLATAFYLHYDESMFVSLRRTWDLTEGYTLPLFGYYLVSVIVFLIINMAIRVFGDVFGIVFSLLSPLATIFASVLFSAIGAVIMSTMIYFLIMKLYVDLIAERKKGKSKLEF